MFKTVFIDMCDLIGDMRLFSCAGKLCFDFQLPFYVNSEIYDITTESDDFGPLFKFIAENEKISARDIIKTEKFIRENLVPVKLEGEIMDFGRVTCATRYLTHLLIRPEKKLNMKIIPCNLILVLSSSSHEFTKMTYKDSDIVILMISNDAAGSSCYMVFCIYNKTAYIWDPRGNEINSNLDVVKQHYPFNTAYYVKNPVYADFDFYCLQFIEIFSRMDVRDDVMGCMKRAISELGDLEKFKKTLVIPDKYKKWRKYYANRREESYKLISGPHFNLGDDVVLTKSEYMSIYSMGTKNLLSFPAVLSKDTRILILQGVGLITDMLGVSDIVNICKYDYIHLITKNMEIPNCKYRTDMYWDTNEFNGFGWGAIGDGENMYFYGWHKIKPKPVKNKKNHILLDDLKEDSVYINDIQKVCYRSDYGFDNDPQVYTEVEDVYCVYAQQFRMILFITDKKPNNCYYKC